jgi:hypothetical protein
VPGAVRRSAGTASHFTFPFDDGDRSGFTGAPLYPFHSGVLTLYTSNGKKAEGAGREIAYYARCDNAWRAAMFPEGHKLAAQNCPNGKRFPHALFETLLLRLFDPCIESMLAEVIPHAHGDDLLEGQIPRPTCSRRNGPWIGSTRSLKSPTVHVHELDMYR